jgi:hypothetical protein
MLIIDVRMIIQRLKSCLIGSLWPHVVFADSFGIPWIFEKSSMNVPCRLAFIVIYHQDLDLFVCAVKAEVLLSQAK